MRYSIILWTLIGFGFMQIASAMEQAAPAPQPAQPVQQPQQLPVVQPVARLRQHFNTLLTQFEALNNVQMAQELNAVNTALNDMQQAINQYQEDNNHHTSNTAKVMNAFFETLKNKITTCQDQILQLPAAGDDELEQDVRAQQLNVIREELGQLQNQLNTLFRILGGMRYRLAPTQAAEQDVAMRVWNQQSRITLANIVARAGIPYGLNLLAGANNPQEMVQALDAAKQEADNLHTESLIGQHDSTVHLFDLAGRLGGYGFGKYNWMMPHLIAAANRFLPDEPDPAELNPEKRQINKIMNLLYLFDTGGRINNFGHESTIPIEHPQLIRSIIRYVPTRLIRWVESTIRTAHNNNAPQQNWGARLKASAAKYGSRLVCSFLRATLGRSFYSLEGGVFRGAPVSDRLARVKAMYRNPLWKHTIDLGLDFAAYRAPEIRAGAAALNQMLHTWKTCATADDERSLDARATAIREQRNRNLINGNMRAQFDGWAQHWNEGRQGAA